MVNRDRPKTTMMMMKDDVPLSSEKRCVWIFAEALGGRAPLDALALKRRVGGRKKRKKGKKMSQSVQGKKHPSRWKCTARGDFIPEAVRKNKAMGGRS